MNRQQQVESTPITALPVTQIQTSSVRTIRVSKDIDQDQDKIQILNETERLSKSPDPHEYFKEQSYVYPVKDEEQSFMNKLFSEKLTGFCYCQSYILGIGILPTAKCSSFCNMVCFFYFIIFGLVFMEIARNIVEIRIRYDDVCANMTMCVLNVTLDDDISAPIYLYYELDEFYSNHKFYVDSIQPKQMAGQDISQQEAGSFCMGAQTNNDMLSGDQLVLNSGSGYILDNFKPANPCGLAAKYIFNDSFVMTGPTKVQGVHLNQTDITFSFDSEYRFDKNPQFAFLQWLDMKDEHTMNWFSIQTLPQMTRLWARIDLNMDKGDYQMLIYNNYPTNIFKGSKSILLSTTSEFGTKNLALGEILLTISGCYAAAFLYIIMRQARNSKKKKIRVQPQEEESRMKRSFDKSSLDFSSIKPMEKMKQKLHSKED